MGIVATWTVSNLLSTSRLTVRMISLPTVPMRSLSSEFWFDRSLRLICVRRSPCFRPRSFLSVGPWVRIAFMRYEPSS